jgi:hypothetical protein
MPCRLFTILSLVCLLAASSQAQHITIDKQPFEGTPYTMDVPEGWKLLAPYDRADRILLSPVEGEADPFREHIQVVLINLDKPITNRLLAESDLSTKKANFENFKLIHAAPANLGPHDAVLGYYALQTGSEKRHQVTYYLTHEMGAYQVTVVLSADNPKAFSDVIAASIASFRLQLAEAQMAEEQAQPERPE